MDRQKRRDSDASEHTVDVDSKRRESEVVTVSGQREESSEKLKPVAMTFDMTSARGSTGVVRFICI